MIDEDKWQRMSLSPCVPCYRYVSVQLCLCSHLTLCFFMNDMTADSTVWLCTNVARLTSMGIRWLPPRDRWLWSCKHLHQAAACCKINFPLQAWDTTLSSGVLTYHVITQCLWMSLASLWNMSWKEGSFAFWSQVCACSLPPQTSYGFWTGNCSHLSSYFYHSHEMNQKNMTDADMAVFYSMTKC